MDTTPCLPPMRIKLELYNAQQAVYETKLKLMAVTCWSLMCDMFNSHAKTSDEIHQVANKYADKVSDLTTTNGWLKILKKHRKYLNVCKRICCELQKKRTDSCKGSRCYLVTLDFSPSLFHGKGEGLSRQCSC